MGRFPSWKSPGKQPIKKRGIKRFLSIVDTDIDCGPRFADPVSETPMLIGLPESPKQGFRNLQNVLPSVIRSLRIYPYPMVWPLPRPWSETMVSVPLRAQKTLEIKVFWVWSAHFWIWSRRPRAQPKGPFRTKNITTIAKIANYYAVVFWLRPPQIYYAVDPSWRRKMSVIPRKMVSAQAVLR